ncbi:MAG: hypothetical protein RLO81_08805 [Fulvivirga sp.]|uniref:hypothetical protein n=1 Tax=Fulvivirga sp. TaxID=1931237 RepID=UPI0032EDFEA7
MKKINILFILLSVVAFNAHAQVQKGDSNIGSNFGLLSQKGDDPLLTYSATYISLNYQYYVGNRVSLGIAPAWNITKVVDNAIAFRSRSINLFIDYNFLSANGKVMPYFGFKYTAMRTNVVFEDPNAAFGVLSGTAAGALDGFTGGATGGAIPGGSFQLPEGEVTFSYIRTIMSLSAGIKFFVTERINIDNNLTIGKVTKETVEGEFFGTSFDLGTDDPGSLIQFTVGFGYIIGRKGS